MNETFTFAIRSKKHGLFSVIAPERFREILVRYTWCVAKDYRRTPGREFVVETAVRGDDGKFRIRLLSRMVWELIGNAPVRFIDHRDGQPLNNAEDNLRDGTLGNAWNKQRLRNNTSGIIGVHWNAKSQKWEASIRVRSKRLYLGMFTDLALAKVARDAAAKELHGEFAVLNP